MIIFNNDIYKNICSFRHTHHDNSECIITSDTELPTEFITRVKLNKWDRDNVYCLYIDKFNNEQLSNIIKGKDLFKVVYFNKDFYTLPGEVTLKTLNILMRYNILAKVWH